MATRRGGALRARQAAGAASCTAQHSTAQLTPQRAPEECAPINEGMHSRAGLPMCQARPLAVSSRSWSVAVRTVRCADVLLDGVGTYRLQLLVSPNVATALA